MSDYKKDLSLEEMDSVTGGTYNQSRVDSELLFNLGLLGRKYSQVELQDNWSSCTAAINAGWAKAGIVVLQSKNGENQYFSNGTQISWERAKPLACEASGK